MYFPYLRGKQYELLALKELAGVLGPVGKVIPILEPVRDPKGSGLERCLDALRINSMRFTLVVNPKVGALTTDSQIAPSIRDFIDLKSDLSSNWNLSLIIDEHTNLDQLLSDYQDSFGNRHPLTLIHLEKFDNLDSLRVKTDQLNRVFDVINVKLRKRHYSKFLERSQGVAISDPFPAKARNSDFSDSLESTFSEEHLYYKDDGWFGFSDFLTIGDNYTESGFTPRAVAIHWTFQKSNDGPIYIRHFTSDRSEDTSDVAGKFLEALKKLVTFLDELNISTQAADVLRTHYRNQTFPGLGILKKLSMQNHLELVSNILGH